MITFHRAVLVFSTRAIAGLGCFILASFGVSAATIIWSGASGTDTNWSNGNNWLGTVAPGSGDDAKFFNAGTNSVSGLPNSLVDASFGGTIGSLQFGNTNGFHTAVIADGMTLNVTGAGGLIVGTPGDLGASHTNYATITGTLGTLNVNNSSAVISLNQGTATSVSFPQSILDLSTLGNFNANVSRIGIGTTVTPNPGNANQREAGTLYLAMTNNITAAYSVPLATYQTLSSASNSIELNRNPGNNGGSITHSALYLGLTNVFNVDSIDIGRDKSDANCYGFMGFNPVFVPNNPVAFFYGTAGPGSRVTWWSVGDGGANASSSHGGYGICDFTGGIVNAWVNVLSLGRDCSPSSTWAGPNRGVLTFTTGTIDANTVLIGNQSLGPSTSTTPNVGVVTVNGANAVLRINTGLTLGNTANSTSTAAQNTYGILNVTNGTVYANNISVGPYTISANNAVNLSGATLVVSNTLASTTFPLTNFYAANSTLGLTITASATVVTAVGKLTTGGSTNLIQLNNPTPVIFPSYPQQFPLIKYAAWNGTNNFGLADVPGWAPGAMVVSNGVTGASLDLVVPTDPRPVFTAEPLPYSGTPGDDVTTNLSVAIAAGSVTPLGYQWYFVTNNVTNSLADGAGPSGSSALTGSATANLQIVNAQPADSGNYFVVVTNFYGTSSSSLALLTISASAIAPNVTGPGAVTATNGITTVIANSVSGSPLPVVYWQYNGTNLSDGTGPSGSSTIAGSGSSILTIVNPQYPGDQGMYSLIASNSAGMATNSTVFTVLVPPAITAQPASLVVTNTQAAFFTVAATGMASPSYQWYKNGSPISLGINPTAASATLSIASAAPGDTASYYVNIFNTAGSTNSATVMLTVNSVMTATTLMPANGTAGVCYDTPLYLTFNAAPVLRPAGTIRIYNVTNSATPVDTLNMSQGTLQAHSLFAGDSQGFNYYPVIITGGTAAIYPHSGVMTSNQTYYVTIDDGVFADADGAYFVGITSPGTWQFTTKAGGPANPANMVVAQDYSGDFATVQGAVDSVPAGNATPRLINIRSGNYVEIVNISGKNNLDLRGESRAATIVGYANNAGINGSTHSRMAFKVNANDIALDNLTITNSTAQDLSQAEALMIESSAQRIIVNNCNVDSYQDTILANISTSKAYFNNSVIQGDVDFIWGGGNLFFTNCEIRYLVRAGNSAALGPNPSPSSTDISSNGFSFVNCALTTLPGANPNDTVGRTRSITNGNTALLNCFISTNIGGWYSDALPTGSYRNWYYNCTNDLGASVTLSNGISLSGGDPNVALAGSATAWLYGWTPALLPNIIAQPASQSAGAGQPVTFAVSATGIPDPTYQWFKNGTNLPAATNATLNIPGAQRSDGITYYVVASNGSGSVTSSVVTLTYNNTAPVAGPNFTMGALIGVPSAVQIIGGKYSPTDADNDPLTVAGVAGATNGTVATDGLNVTYTATNGTGDAFTYTVSDGFGGTAGATVTVAISSNIQGYNQLAAASLGNGTNVLTFAGIPTYNYALDLATNLTPPINWMPQATNPAANNGALMFTNVSTEPQSFYRTRYVP